MVFARVQPVLHYMCVCERNAEHSDAMRFEMSMMFMIYVNDDDNADDTLRMESLESIKQSHGNYGKMHMTCENVCRSSKYHHIIRLSIAAYRIERKIAHHKMMMTIIIIVSIGIRLTAFARS